jgi:hypothetical protein
MRPKTNINPHWAKMPAMKNRIMTRGIANVAEGTLHRPAKKFTGNRGIANASGVATAVQAAKPTLPSMSWRD